MQILCVERSALGLAQLKRNAARAAPGAVIRSCRDSREALEMVRSEGCDVLLTEIDLGGDKWEGLHLAEQVKSVNPRVNIIFVTVCSERECAEELLRLRVSGFVTKPYEAETLTEEFANLRYPV